MFYIKINFYNLDLTPSDIDHINCHATSTQVGDSAEAKAIAKLLENTENIKKTSISACKGAIGHCFAGAGAIETIFALLSMNQVEKLFLLLLLKFD